MRARIFAATAAISAIIGTGVVAANSRPAEAAAVYSGFFIRSSANTGQCLSVTSGETYGLVVMGPCGVQGGANDLWHWTSAADDQLEDAAGACLGLYQGKTTILTQLYGVDGCDGATRYWTMIPNSAGQFQLENQDADAEAAPNGPSAVVLEPLSFGFEWQENS